MKSVSGHGTGSCGSRAQLTATKCNEPSLDATRVLLYTRASDRWLCPRRCCVTGRGPHEFGIRPWLWVLLKLYAPLLHRNLQYLDFEMPREYSKTGASDRWLCPRRCCVTGRGPHEFGVRPWLWVLLKLCAPLLHRSVTYWTRGPLFMSQYISRPSVCSM